MGRLLIVDMEELLGIGCVIMEERRAGINQLATRMAGRDIDGLLIDRHQSRRPTPAMFAWHLFAQLGKHSVFRDLDIFFVASPFDRDRARLLRDCARDAGLHLSVLLSLDEAPPWVSEAKALGNVLNISQLLELEEAQS